MHIYSFGFYTKVAVIILAALMLWAIIIWFPVMAPFVPLLLSVALLSFVVFRLYKYYEFSKWDVVEGVVKNIEERYLEKKESVYLSVKEYYPEVEYQYKHNGVLCESNKVFFDIRDILVCEVDMSGNAIGEEARPWQTWSKGGQVKVYVNPHKKCESLLFVKISKGNLYRTTIYTLSALLLFLLWYFIEDVHKLLAPYYS